MTPVTYVVTSRNGEPGVRVSTLADAERFQRVLGGEIVVEQRKVPA